MESNIVFFSPGYVSCHYDTLEKGAVFKGKKAKHPSYDKKPVVVIYDSH